MAARIYFFRNKAELIDHPANGMEFVGQASKTGQIGRFTAHGKLFVKKPGRNNPTLLIDPSDFGGEPLMAKKWYGKGEVEWVAFATKEQVAQAGGTSSEFSDDHIGRDGRGVDYQGHWPFDEWLATQQEAIN